jgi:hypothetical protein
MFFLDDDLIVRAFAASLQPPGLNDFLRFAHSIGALSFLFLVLVEGQV